MPGTSCAAGGGLTPARVAHVTFASNTLLHLATVNPVESSAHLLPEPEDCNGLLVGAAPNLSVERLTNTRCLGRDLKAVLEGAKYLQDTGKEGRAKQETLRDKCPCRKVGLTFGKCSAHRGRS